MYKKRYSNGKTSIYRKNRNYNQYNLYGGNTSLEPENSLMSILVQIMVTKIKGGNYNVGNADRFFESFFAESGFVGENKKEKFKKIFKENLNSTSEMQAPNLNKQIEDELKKATVGKILCAKTGDIVKNVIQLIDNNDDAMVLEMFPINCDTYDFIKTDGEGKPVEKIKAYFTYESPLISFVDLLKFQLSQDDDFLGGDVNDNVITFIRNINLGDITNSNSEFSSLNKIDNETIKNYLIVATAAKATIGVYTHTKDIVLDDEDDAKDQANFIINILESKPKPNEDNQGQNDKKDKNTGVEKSVDELLNDILKDDDKTLSLVAMILDKPESEINKGLIKKNPELSTLFTGKKNASGLFTIAQVVDEKDLIDGLKRILNDLIKSDGKLKQELQKISDQ